MNREFTIYVFNKDAKLLKSIKLDKLFTTLFPNEQILDIKRVGNRSVVIDTKNNIKYKVKGIGVEKYTEHYANSTDNLYNQFVGKTDIKYMRYRVVNPKLFNIKYRNIIIADLPYQDFIGEPIGGCGSKELRAFKHVSLISEPNNILESIPVKFINIFNDMYPIYIVFWKMIENNIGERELEWEDIKEKQVQEQVANTLYSLFNSGLVVPKDKNILADFNNKGFYKDIADLYVIDTKDIQKLKLHFFGTLYNFFRLLFYESPFYSNYESNSKYVKSFYSLLYSLFHSQSLSKNNNKKEIKKKTRLENKAIKELDEIKIGYLIARILDLELPTAKELNHFLKSKLGGNINKYQVGDKLALTSYWIMDKYYHYNYTLAEMI